MKKLLYALMFLPILLTAATFRWVLSGELKLRKSMEISLPQIGEPLKSDDPLVKKGQEAFNAKGCVYCHGPNGAGGVKNNNAQGGEVPSLTNVSKGYSPEELRNKILTGVHNVAKADASGPVPPLYMPTWRGHLTDEELSALVAFLTSLAPKGGGEEF